MEKARNKMPFLKQKPRLYFDENIPCSAIEHFSNSTFWDKKFKFISAVKLGYKGKSDEFHFALCKEKCYSIVSLDTDFIKDTNFPFCKMPGIIIVKAGNGEKERIKDLLENFLNFINQIRLPKIFLGDSKFIISSEGCVMWGRDAKTGELKELEIIAGKTTIQEICNHFTYLIG